ncbi:unnamed protein product [Chrysoparadoxa australica]
MRRGFILAACLPLCHLHAYTPPPTPRPTTRPMKLEALKGNPSPKTILISTVASGLLLAAGATMPTFSGSFWPYHQVADIPSSKFKAQHTLTGVVQRVSDGDTLRIRHTPKLNLRFVTKKGKLSETALAVRIYGVDCPEVAHFGNKAQPFSAEATAFTKAQVNGQRVKIKLLQRDQYSRAIARVTYGTWPFRKDLSAELLKNGLAVMYRQGGAQYDGREAMLEKIEAKAKSDKVGLWKAGKLKTPAQYKAEVKAKTGG